MVRRIRALQSHIRGGTRLHQGRGDQESLWQEGCYRELSPVDEIKATLVAAGLTVVDHRRVGEARIPAHVLIAQAG